jgi:hypothetical protein
MTVARRVLQSGRHYRQEPRQQAQRERACSANKTCAHVGNVKRISEGQSGHRDPKPASLDEIGQEFDLYEPE